jgi:hypothetical protein
MEEQKFEELATKARKRWARAQKLTIVYTILALVGGSLWLAIAYYQARRLKRDLQVKSTELDHRQADLDTANLNIARQLIALEIERKNNERAIEALQKVKAGAPDSNVIAQNTLNVIAKEQLKPSPKPEASTAPTPPKTDRTSPYLFKVSPGSHIAIYIYSQGMPNLSAVAKDGMGLAFVPQGTPSGKMYPITIDKQSGETVSVLIEFVFLPSAPDGAKYAMQLQQNGSVIPVNDSSVSIIAKSDPVLTRVYRFQVQ